MHTTTYCPKKRQKRNKHMDPLHNPIYEKPERKLKEESKQPFALPVQALDYPIPNHLSHARQKLFNRYRC